MIWMENDAKGCFDRIRPVLALINCRRLGASTSSCRALAEVWKRLTHRVKTGNGLGDESYHQDPNTFQAGAGQDSTIAMICWCLISSQILALIDKMPKLRIVNAISNTITFTRNSITYVDDTSHANSIARDETIHQQANAIALELTSDLRLTAQKSEKARHISGGDYSLPKCHFSIMTQKWLPSGASTLHLIAEPPASLSITQGSNTTLVPISRKEPHESCRTLGCHIAIDGNSKTQERVLWTAATLSGAGMRHRGTTKVDAYMKYISFIFPALSSPLGVTDVDQSALSEIERRYLRPTKQQLRFRYTVASALMFAPRAYMGMGLDSVPISSDIQHI
jgi:hypothetical protein